MKAEEEQGHIDSYIIRRTNDSGSPLQFTKVNYTVWLKHFDPDIQVLQEKAIVIDIEKVRVKIIILHERNAAWNMILYNESHFIIFSELNISQTVEFHS